MQCSGEMQSKLTCRALSAHTLSFLLNTFNDNTVTTQMGEYSYPVAQDLKHIRTSFHSMQTYHNRNGIMLEASVMGVMELKSVWFKRKKLQNFVNLLLKNIEN